VIDIHQKWLIRRKLKQLQRELDLTMIYVTHDQHEALTFAEQVTVMDTGIALQTGGPHDLHNHPEAPFVGYFIGSPGMNIFSANLKGNQIQAGEFSLDLTASAVGQASGQDLKVGIRPEFVEIYTTQATNRFECSVKAVHMTGTSKILDLSGAALTFKARVEDTSNIQTGDIVWVRFPFEKTIIYANDRALAIEEASA
jgi:glycerol transport system ATP-binding protein